MSANPSLVWIVAVATIRAVSLDGGVDRQYLMIGIGVLAVIFLVLFFVGAKEESDAEEAAEAASHPNAFPKKIALAGQGPMLTGQDFRAIWDMGKLEPGSSGSPLFSGAKRVIGPACCVSDFTCNGQWAIYGKFGDLWFRLHHNSPV